MALATIHVLTSAHIRQLPSLPEAEYFAWHYLDSPRPRGRVNRQISPALLIALEAVPSGGERALAFPGFAGSVAPLSLPIETSNSQTKAVCCMSQAGSWKVQNPREKRI